MLSSHWYGFGLSLLTALLWGVLPLFINMVLSAMDAITITWYRFAVAAMLLWGILWHRQALPALRQLGQGDWLLLLLAGLGLSINYVAYVVGLDYLNPETAQVLIQLAPFMLMLGGMLWFNERFGLFESIGAAVLLMGLVLFFNDRIDVLLTSLGRYTLGVLVMILAALSWAAYALLQKRLLRTLTAQQLNLLMYAFGGIVLLPFSAVLPGASMSLLQWLALLFCCLNTLVAYGAFTQALQCWHGGKVSAVIALAPLFTIIAMELAVGWFPAHFSPSEINSLAYLGAALVIGGSILASLGKGRSL